MGVFLVKKVDLSSTQGALCTVSVFFILHLLIWGVRTHPTHSPPLPTGLAYCDLTVHRRAKCFSVVRLVYRERVS